MDPVAPRKQGQGIIDVDMTQMIVLLDQLYMGTFKLQKGSQFQAFSMVVQVT